MYEIKYSKIISDRSFRTEWGLYFMLLGPFSYLKKIGKFGSNIM
jgi:hypothetical protein